MLIDRETIEELIYGDAIAVDEINVREAAKRIEAYLMQGATTQIGMGIFADINEPLARVAVMNTVEDAELFTGLDPRHRAVVTRRRATVETQWEVLGDDE